MAAGVVATERCWAPLRIAASWIEQVAMVLANPEGADAATVEAALRTVLAEVLTSQHDPALGEWATHVYRVTRSYWLGLFPCYDDPTIPRTNNELEQYFGMARHHERRATGRKRPPAAVAVRGSVRVVAAVAPQAGEGPAPELRPASVAGGPGAAGRAPRTAPRYSALSPGPHRLPRRAGSPPSLAKFATVAPSQ